MSIFTAALETIATGQSLTRESSREAMSELMTGQWTPVQIAAFLVALKTKGETVEELSGAADAMRAVSIPLKSRSKLIVDTCGTGGDGSGSFNLSTAAAFVVAGAGFDVAKHGNRSVSSQSGSADVLRALGVPIETEVSTVEGCLEKAGIAFLFAPAFNPAMKYAMAVRKELGVRTLFNLLGPLTNPARPHVQLIGVYAARWVKPVASVLVELGCREGVVVHGMGHDEIVLCGETQVAEIEDGVIQEKIWSPEDFGLRTDPLQRLPGGTPEENARLMLDVLNDKPTAYRDVVCMNAAALIRAATRQRTQGREKMTLRAAYEIAEESLKSGHALSKLSHLRSIGRTA